MRILQVIHQFPPHSSQGSELYCQLLSQCLASMGEKVGVFHLSNTQPRYPKRLERAIQDEIRLFHCVDAGEYSRLSSWSNPFLVESFSCVLDEFNPDVVHFHNYLSLGDDLVGLAKSRNIAVIYTLHDYGLICPNQHLLLDGNQLCGKNSANFFEGCCPTLIRVGSGRQAQLASRLPSLARWRQFATNQPGKKRRAMLQAAVKLMEKILGCPETTAVEQKKHFFLTATRTIFSQVDLFLSPSCFLAERYMACGIPQDRIVHLPNGMRHFRRSATPRRRLAHLQLGYIGSFHAHKGIDLLLEAFRGLGDRATLHLHGSSFGSPISAAHFKQSTSHPIEGVVIHGRYDNEQIGTILAGLDAVVVPSRWFENSPLTIQEAQIAGIPVITADVGGMAELVREGVDGRLFRCNDATDLRRVLLSLIEDPEQLLTFQANVPSVPRIETQAHKVRAHYDRILTTLVRD
ncbi:MAG: glycosyltransferase family 4 protein [Cyanobacteriota bacterium]|jgi:glycosyltransferase involved in cell wall biosynthesis